MAIPMRRIGSALQIERYRGLDWSHANRSQSGAPCMRYLHTMVRVTDIDKSLDFYCNKLGMKEVRRVDNEAGRFTLIFLAATEDEASRARDPGAAARTDLQLGSRNIRRGAQLRPSRLRGRRHLCHLPASLMDAGVTINRPPRDGRMAFVRSPDNISIELLQKGEAQAEGRAMGVDGKYRQVVTALSRDAGCIPCVPWQHPASRHSR